MSRDPQDSAAQRILVTGSNGHLGRRLIARIRQAKPAVVVRALVRSERAADVLGELPEADQPHETCIADYSDAGGLERAAAGCQSIVHLVGIIKESANTSYAVAHEGTCQAIARAASEAGVRHIVYLSLFGAASDSGNTCLASRGRAEEILRAGSAHATIMRVPMVLGRGDDAAGALSKMSRGSLVPLLGGGTTLQQPIDAEDLVQAIIAALESPPSQNTTLSLGGPESLSHRDLLRRAAGITGGNPRFVSVPFALVHAVAAVLERLSAHPPVTRAWLGVLQHDDCVDSGETCKRLGIELTPLEETLRRCLSDDGRADDGRADDGTADNGEEGSGLA